jgi:hypothetical protein
MGRLGPIIALLIAGCSEITGLSEYEVSGALESYMNSAACRACLESNCAKQLAGCRDSDECSATHAKRRRCDDPDCHFQAWFPEQEALWNEDGFPTLPSDVDLASCARGFCDRECGIGRSWECVGDYSWTDPARGKPLILRHRAFHAEKLDLDPVAEASVTWCPSNATDEVACLAPAKTWSDGRLEVQIDAAFNFDLTQRIEHPDYPYYMVFGQQRPRYSGEYTSYGMKTRVELEALAQSYGAKLDPLRGYVTLQAFDCGLSGSEDLLLLELEEVVEGAPRPCVGCSHFAVGSQPGSSPGGVIWIILGPAVDRPQAMRITARHPETGAIVARMPILLHPNRIHAGSLMPLTSRAAETL